MLTFLHAADFHLDSPFHALPPEQAAERRQEPNFSECSRPRFGVPVLFPSCGNPDGGVHNFDGKAYPMETHG